MWTKITSVEQLRPVKPGTVLSKYPLEGDPVDTYEGANQDNSGMRTVVGNNMGEIRFVIGGMPQYADIGTYVVKVGDIGKRYSDFIEEGIWWIDL